VQSLLHFAVAWLGGAVFTASLVWFLFCYLVRFAPAPASRGTTPAVAIDVALFSLFAFHHSLFARDAAKQRVRRLVGPELERSVYTWISSIVFIIVCTYWQPVPGVVYDIDGVWRAGAYALQALAVVLTVRAAGALDALDLAGIRPMIDALHDRPQRHVPLETRGLYRVVRHPLYLAWALFVFTTPVMTGTRAAFAIISTGYLAMAIPWEERALVRTFGDDYLRYRSRVRWRMVPGLY
jgi:protein-S-isoprenylcysteine O-methyltransferase Ste14